MWVHALFRFGLVVRVASQLFFFHGFAVFVLMDVVTQQAYEGDQQKRNDQDERHR
jgi:hypothetical protein